MSDGTLTVGEQAAEEKQAAEIQFSLDVLVPRHRQGDHIKAGATVDIGGGQFRIASFGSAGMHLECQPGTTIIVVVGKGMRRLGMIKKPPATEGAAELEPIEETRDALINIIEETTTT